MTTVRLPDTSTYTTTELVSCQVTPSARVYGSEGWEFESLRARPAQRRFPAFGGASVGYLTTLLATVVFAGPWTVAITVPGSAANPCPKPPHVEPVRSHRHTSLSSQKSSYDAECLHRCCLDIHREQQRGTRMPKVVQSDAAHISSSAKRFERSVDVPRLQRRPVLRCEYQTECVGPCDPRITELVTPMAPQDRNELPRQRLRGGRRFGFHVPQARFVPTRESAFAITTRPLTRSTSTPVGDISSQQFLLDGVLQGRTHVSLI